MVSGDGQGDDIAMAYMHWAKTHSRVRYELTGSGVPAAAPMDIGARLTSPDLEVRGPYGDPELIDAVAKRGVAGASPGAPGFSHPLSRESFPVDWRNPRNVGWEPRRQRERHRNLVPA